ncbi:MAG: TlpA family protein disulfide reductase [bacterium]|nr:TlpA family protein disulfide reductase [bacterium]
MMALRPGLLPRPAILLPAVLLSALLIGAGAHAHALAVPDWTLADVQGRPVTLHDELERGPVVLSFWALWCGPCLKEQAHLAKLATELRGRVTVLAVNVDTPRSVHKVAPWVTARATTT